jgi:hypothetical protein
VPTERIDPPYETDERTMLTAWLDYHRATLERKCEGLTAEQLRMRAVPASDLSLLGIVRHLGSAEYLWFRFWLAGEEPNNPHDGDIAFAIDDADVPETFAFWRGEYDHAREVLARFASLDEVGAGQAVGAGISVRWTLVHMIEEYARHNGHADLIREAIDGARGD